MFLLPAAFAYETDQISRRAEPLEDITDAANAEANRLLDHAVEVTNRLTSCAAPRDKTWRTLAAQVYRVTSGSEFIPDRGELNGFGHSTYSAWLETAEVSRRTFPGDASIYGDIDPTEAFILGAAGICSTVRINGVLMGTDKPDHFFAQGYEYLLASRYGRDDAAAVAWGTRSELGIYGLLTSDAFSWADLYANWQGYQFYKGMLQKGSVFELDEEGCVTRAHPFDWREWLDDGADELVNPPVYTDHVAEVVRARLHRDRRAICEGWSEWGPPAMDRRTQVVAREQVHVSARAPERRDEWGLEQLCTATPQVSKRPE